DAAQAEKTFRVLGRYVAEDNLTTIYKIVLAFAKPKHIMSMLPKFWQMYFGGIEVRSEATGPSTGVCYVTGLPFFAISPAACGWMELAYEKVGGSAQITERAWTAGERASSVMTFDVTWQAKS